MPKAARRTSGPNAASSNRIEPYAKSPKTTKKADKENVDPKPRSTNASQADKGDYRDIPLDEVKGEIPCYDNAATVRRKLNKLITDKATIPGTNKKWTQAAMTKEMQELETRGHAVEYKHNAIGPTARSLGIFLKKTGNAMLEKLRIYNGEKKSKPRLEAEKQ
ncbi:hypothetical protein MMC28_009507 [Mycoblastus sanguinarius]|nr:hypothetical protein [Mycoblastus sanguinarius]